MIWKATHLFHDFKLQLNKKTPYKESTETGKENFRVGIVGGGPKGMYALDTLVSKVLKFRVDFPITIDWYNKAADFGAGPNYDTDQPDNLLINYAIGNINAWECNDDSRLSLLNWLTQHTALGEKPTALDFASRAVVGYYLKDCCSLLIEQLPQYVTLNRVVCDVTDIECSDQSIYVHSNRYDSVILCTGHSYASKFVNKRSVNSPVYEAYPVKGLQNLKGLKNIAIQGMGLSFIDTVITLSSSADPCNIPKMLPYSRTNLPMLPRVPQVASEIDSSTFLHHDYWQGLINKKNTDFDTEVLPFLNDEICFTYYTIKDNLSSYNAEYGKENILSSNEPFSLHRLLFPNDYLSEKDRRYYNSWVLKYLQEAIARCKSNEIDPISSALHKLREFRPIMEKIYAHGGLNPESQKKFDNYWYPAISRVCFGPPVINAEKLVELIRSGKLLFNFSSPPQVKINEGHVLLENEAHESIKCDALIYAHIPKANLPTTVHPLYSPLISRGIAKLYSNGSHETGAIKINDRGRVTGKRANKLALFAYGTPTESNVLDNDSLSRWVHNYAEDWSEFVIDKIIKIEGKS